MSGFKNQTHHKTHQDSPYLVKPLSSDPYLTVDVTGIHDDGYGISEHEGKQLAVVGVLPGETAEVRVFAKRKKRLFARPTNILVSSPDRIESKCPYGNFCGGCSFQHMNPVRQIEFKQRRLLTLLENIGSFSVLEPLTGPVGGYRRKARLGVRYVTGKQRVLVGFREKASGYIAEIDRCEVLDERVGSILLELSNLIGSLSIFTMIPQIEVAIGDQISALVIRHLEPLLPEDEALLCEFAETHSQHIYLQSGGIDTVRRLCPQQAGNGLSYFIPDYDVTMAFDPLDFVQINHDINLRLIRRVDGLLDLKSEDRLLDLFCGIGNFSLPYATKVGSVTGVEGSAEAVARASSNAQLNKITNTNFVTADLLAQESALHLNETEANKVLVDPPRTGAHPMINELKSLSPDTIVYVSCNPVTLVRDAYELVAGGYELTSAGVIDMFPQTNHIESVAVFEK